MPQMDHAPVTSTLEVHQWAAVSSLEWWAVCQGRCNVLLEGPRASTEATLARLMPQLRGIVQWNQPTARLDLPHRGVRTLIVRDVSELQGSEQKSLDRWLAETGRHTQIISTTAQPLFSLVKLGRFDERLYYRLNVLLLQIK